MESEIEDPKPKEVEKVDGRPLKQKPNEQKPAEQKPASTAPKTTPTVPNPILKKEDSGEDVAKETPSLRRAVAAVEEQKETSVLEKLDNPFTPEALIETWLHFAEMKVKQGAGDSEKLILSRELKKEGDRQVAIALRSELEVNILDRFELELVGFLRKELKNDHITIRKDIQQDDAPQKLYTSSDKYEYLLKQNPKLKELKERLGLDFEF